jgi:CHAT domain-containing protein
MILKSFIWLFTIPALILPGLCLAGDSELSGFRNDPLCFHENLRRRAMEGTENRKILEDLHEVFQEHSFDGLLTSPPKGNAGFILLYGAWVLWCDYQYDEALLLYTKARQLFLEADMGSESRFCLYYMARIAAEQEKFPESLKFLNQSLAEGGTASEPYLEGLINESMGYALWYMDRLPESTESYGKATELWLRIGYKTGMVNCWSNLGLLFQELDLPNQAWRSYENAINYLQDDTFPEIRFHLYRNCALFHLRNNNRDLARKYLLSCSEYRQCDENLYAIAKAEILEQPELLDTINPGSPSNIFIRDLIKARFRKKEGKISEAMNLIRKVIKESQNSNMPRHTREARLALAEILEEQESTSEARVIFQQALNESDYLDRIDVLLPFSRTAERQLNGLIRCMIRSGEVNSARETIQEAVWLKTRKGIRLLNGLKNQAESERLLSRAVIKMDTEVSSPIGRIPMSTTPPEGATMLEFWPDGKEVFVWIDNPDSHHFLQLNLDDWIQDTIPRLTSSLYARDIFLPPEPPAEISANLYRQLFLPLEHLFKNKRLLIIAHKKLQSFPFEMLLSGPGEYLLEKYSFSYLPGRHYLGQAREITQPPVLIQPSCFSSRAGAAAESKSLQYLYPDLKIVRSLDIRSPITAGWIHLTSHLRMDRRYWLNSTLTSGDETKPMAEFLEKNMKCTLLSLGVCESANSATAASPYWMGFSEILMLNGADTLLTSRWRMDELSALIYTGFFKLCHDGLPMDEALQKSRVKFLNPEKYGLPPQVSHPFYWAGITYVGEPGRHLPNSGLKNSRAGIVPIIFWLMLLAAALFRAEGSVAAKRILSAGRNRSRRKK